MTKDLNPYEGVLTIRIDLSATSKAKAEDKLREIKEFFDTDMFAMGGAYAAVWDDADSCYWILRLEG